MFLSTVILATQDFYLLLSPHQTRDNLRVAAFVSKLKGIISLDQSNIQSHHHPCFIGQAAVETEARLIPILNVDVVFQALQGNTLNSSSLVPLT